MCGRDYSKRFVEKARKAGEKKMKSGEKGTKKRPFKAGRLLSSPLIVILRLFEFPSCHFEEIGQTPQICNFISLDQFAGDVKDGFREFVFDLLHISKSFELFFIHRLFFLLFVFLYYFQTKLWLLNQSQPC
jgi:hypothetical protein